MPNSSIPKSKRFGYRKRPMPPEADLIAEARRVYAYSDEHKTLVWKAHKNPLRPWPPLGTVVGGDDGHGYLGCLLLGHKFKVHQVVWMVVYGEVPRTSIDHRNCDRRDNRIENLRLATDMQNGHNRTVKITPMTGVQPTKGGGKFQARLGYKGRKILVGSFFTPEEAHTAYLKAKRELYGEFMRE
jgi:hypothetical protein